MNKITVLKSRGIGYSMMIGDNVSTINPDPVTVEITDEEIESLKYDLGLKNSNDWDRGYNYAITHLWDYIKSRINSQS